MKCDREATMRWRFIPFLVALALTACDKLSRPTAPGGKVSPPRDEEMRTAAAFIDRVEESRSYRMGIRPDMAKELAAARLDRATLLKGCIRLLQQGSPVEKKKSARFLGRVGDPSAIAPLVVALGDADEEVREEACYALGWLHAKGETVASALVRLCRHDRSIAVRVAAGVALAGAHDKDAVAAFELGLNTRKGGPAGVDPYALESIWEICEDKLKERGKLRLPLPEHVYTDISQERYREIKADGFYWKQRETVKDGTIYLEVVQRVHHARLYREWYRVKAAGGGQKKPE
jgi:hypothetical protein